MRKAASAAGLAVACLLSTVSIALAADPGTEDPNTGRNTIGLSTPGDIVRSIRSTRTCRHAFRRLDRSWRRICRKAVSVQLHIAECDKPSSLFH